MFSIRRFTSNWYAKKRIIIKTSSKGQTVGLETEQMAAVAEIIIDNNETDKFEKMIDSWFYFAGANTQVDCQLVLRLLFHATKGYFSTRS